MNKLYLLIFIIVLAILTSCNNKIDEPEATDTNEEETIEVDTTPKKSDDTITIKFINEAEAVIGQATLSESEEGVSISVEASDLPEGEHGFHIHEVGLCEAPKFESAGGHFNPTNKQHGFKNDAGFHAGDLKNLIVGPNGNVKQTVVNEHVTLKEGEANSLMRPQGSSLIIHENRDDYMTDPSGNSGDRIACAVIDPTENR